jgi:hypothetical protein
MFLVTFFEVLSCRCHDPVEYRGHIRRCVVVCDSLHGRAVGGGGS